MDRCDDTNNIDLITRLAGQKIIYQLKPGKGNSNICYFTLIEKFRFIPTTGTNQMNQNTISDLVKESINELPASPPPEQEGIRELLEKLQRRIESDENLPSESETEALNQVKALVEAAKNAGIEEHRSLAFAALQRLRGIVKEAPKAKDFQEACEGLLPQISTVFGL